MNAQYQATGFRFTGWHMLAVVVAFFGTIISVNVFMAYSAISTFPGLNAKNSYVASQNYNRLLDDAAAQEAQGWQARLTAPDGVLLLELRERSGALLSGFEVSALVGRPAGASQDKLLDFAATAKGFSAMEALPRGRWLVSIEAHDNDELLWRSTRSIVVD
ncbi:FixH family protein [Aureimonas fodinaquatilis]|uniref:FixH family protein n=1 Tax=Aureimonas fodinaquatilis TaxID=2565783 RepID=A0A5B0E1G0_9HYPH|nr:FixH family protein [Aureimonas fodinaquatilis]KAA0971801.1 FixH family protein [Aureimonas fodinaquatilis]